MHTPLENLIKAKALIEKPEHWTQGEFAKTLQGERTETFSPDAVCWCSAGALIKVGALGLYSEERVHLDRALKELFQYTDGIINFNDERSHSEVMQVWEKAIEYARNS